MIALSARSPTPSDPRGDCVSGKLRGPPRRRSGESKWIKQRIRQRAQITKLYIALTRHGKDVVERMRMVDQRILRREQTHVRIALLHDSKDGLGRVHADTPALNDPLLPHPRQGGEGALERDGELLLPGGRQQFVVGRA
jgi:hypothetical protein